MYFIRFVLSFGFLFAFSSCLIGFFLLGDIYYGDFIDDIAIFVVLFQDQLIYIFCYLIPYIYIILILFSSIIDVSYYAR